MYVSLAHYLEAVTFYEQPQVLGLPADQPFEHQSRKQHLSQSEASVTRKLVIETKSNEYSRSGGPYEVLPNCCVADGRSLVKSRPGLYRAQHFFGQIHLK